MSRVRILAIPLLLILVLLIGMGAGACGGGEVTLDGEEEEEEEVVSSPPTPGEWTASTEFGELGFTVTSGSTGIAEISVSFVAFECGGTQMSGGVSVEDSSTWPITDGQFTVDVFISPWDVVIEGEFDETGTQASGTWEIDGCSGTWAASH